MSDELHLLGAHGDDGSWCDQPGITTTEPMDATCTQCLRLAASYGARAAVRCMAVENAETGDAELMAERDAAMKDATDAKKALMDRGMFLCQECRKVRSLSVQIGYQVPGDPPLIWCNDCKKANA